MTCEIFRKEYPFPSKDLPSEALKHLEDCADCQQYWEEAWKYLKWIQAIPGEFPKEKVWKRIAQKVGNFKPARRVIRLWWSLGLASSFAILLIWFWISPGTEKISQQFFLHPSTAVEQLWKDFLPAGG
ncbi:MAG: hypothetical protein V2G33_04515 [bacterium JZ-2024 1]